MGSSPNSFYRCGVKCLRSCRIGFIVFKICLESIQHNIRLFYVDFIVAVDILVNKPISPLP